MPNLTAYEKKTGWRYSIICTNIPDNGITGVPGSHHPQYIDVAHREHAVVETAGVRTAKAMGLRNLPDQTTGRRTVPGAVGAGAHPGTPGPPRTPAPRATGHEVKKRMPAQSVSGPQAA
jgi:hypothetical protein